MPVSVVCDYCGESITDRYQATITAQGNVVELDRVRYMYGDLGHYHSSSDRPCWAEMLDKVRMIHEVSAGLGSTATDLREQMRSFVAQRNSGRTQDESSRWAERSEHQRQYEEMSWEQREALLLDVLGSKRLTAREIS